MKSKIFDPIIEEQYKNLSAEQKSSYLKKIKTQSKISLTISILMLPMLVAVTIIAIHYGLLDNVIELLACYLLCIVICYAIFVILIFLNIKMLKSSDEIKIKNYLVRLEKQKHSEQFSLKNALATEILKFDTQSMEELNCVALLTNQLYETYSKNNELIEIINNNIDITANIFNLESFCFPTQKHTVTTKTYKSFEAKRYHWEWAVTNSNSETEFNSPTIELIPQTDYSVFVKEMKISKNILGEISRKNFQELENIFLLLKRQNIIKQNETLAEKSEWIEKAEFTAFLFLFRCLKLQSIIKQVDLIKSKLFDLTYNSNNMLSNEQTKNGAELNAFVNMTAEEIITALYQSRIFDKDDIITWYLIIEYSKEHISTPYLNIYYNKKLEAEQILNDLIDKEQIENLKSGKYHSGHKYTMLEIDNMDGAQFESFVTELFKNLGYQAESTKLSGDQGVDVIAKKGSQTLAIQAKHYSQAVGNHAIMEVVGGAKIYNATLCYVVTNNYFTKSAKELAAANNVILWDRDKLIEKLSEV